MGKFTILLFLTLTFAFSSVNAQTATPVDVSLSAQASTPQIDLTRGDLARFDLYVSVQKKMQATNVTVSAFLPEGITPVSVTSDNSDGACAFAGNQITCTYPTLGHVGANYNDWLALVVVLVRPVEVGQLTLNANITANEPDNNLSNNSASLSATVVQSSPKSRKRVRFF